MIVRVLTTSPVTTVIVPLTRVVSSYEDVVIRSVRDGMQTRPDAWAGERRSAPCNGIPVEGLYPQDPQVRRTRSR